MNWLRRKTPLPPDDPWNDEVLVVHDKPTNLRQIKRYAVMNLREGGHPPWETGMAHTIVALCNEIDRLHRERAS